jgi:predicted transcriptional regulator
MEGQHQMTKERYRSRVSIIVDVLRAINNEGQDQKMTHILNKANLPYNRLSTFLEELEKLEFIMKKESADKKFYLVTEKGKKFIREYEKFHKLSQAFGLDI